MADENNYEKISKDKKDHIVDLLDLCRKQYFYLLTTSVVLLIILANFVFTFQSFSGKLDAGNSLKNDIHEEIVGQCKNYLELFKNQREMVKELYTELMDNMELSFPEMKEAPDEEGECKWAVGTTGEIMAIAIPEGTEINKLDKNSKEVKPVYNDFIGKFDVIKQGNNDLDITLERTKGYTKSYMEIYNKYNLFKDKDSSASQEQVISKLIKGNQKIAVLEKIIETARTGDTHKLLFDDKGDPTGLLDSDKKLLSDAIEKLKEDDRPDKKRRPLYEKILHIHNYLLKLYPDFASYKNQLDQIESNQPENTASLGDTFAIVLEKRKEVYKTSNKLNMQKELQIILEENYNVSGFKIRLSFLLPSSTLILALVMLFFYIHFSRLRKLIEKTNSEPIWYPWFLLYRNRSSRFFSAIAMFLPVLSALAVTLFSYLYFKGIVNDIGGISYSIPMTSLPGFVLLSLGTGFILAMSIRIFIFRNVILKNKNINKE